MKRRFDNLVTLVNVTYKDLQKLKSLNMQNMGLKGNHAMCLFYLGQNPDGLTSGELCDKCREDKAAVSRTLKYLVEKGYVALNEEDGKKYRLKNVLTEKGRAIYEKIECLTEDSMKAVEKGLEKEELETFYKVFEIVVKNFDDVCSSIEKRL